MTVFDVCGDNPTKEDLNKILSKETAEPSAFDAQQDALSASCKEQEQERSWLLQIADDSEDSSVIELRDQLIMVTKLVHDEELADKKKWGDGLHDASSAQFTTVGSNITWTANTSSAMAMSLTPGQHIRIVSVSPPHKADKDKSPFNKLMKFFGKEK